MAGETPWFPRGRCCAPGAHPVAPPVRAPVLALLGAGTETTPNRAPAPATAGLLRVGAAAGPGPDGGDGQTGALDELRLVCAPRADERLAALLDEEASVLARRLEGG